MKKENLKFVCLDAALMDDQRDLVKGLADDLKKVRNLMELENKKVQNVIELIRSYVDQSDWYSLNDPYIEVSEKGNLALKTNWLNLDDDNNYMILDREPDYIIVTIISDFNDVSLDDYSLALAAIAAVDIHDCTGCCNAMDYANLTKNGLVIAGNVSRTFHS